MGRQARQACHGTVEGWSNTCHGLAWNSPTYEKIKTHAVQPANQLTLPDAPVSNSLRVTRSNLSGATHLVGWPASAAASPSTSLDRAVGQGLSESAFECLISRSSLQSLLPCCFRHGRSAPSRVHPAKTQAPTCINV